MESKPSIVKAIHLILACFLVIGLALRLTQAMVAHADAVEVVTNTNDSGTGSLRQAIADVDPGGTITFNIALPNTITLTTGELIISKNLTITGLGANLLIISGNNASRVFHIAVGSEVNISGVTISGGLTENGNHGGGVYNEGTLMLNNVIVTGNATGSSGNGGGIYNKVMLTLDSCTLSNNSTGNGGDGSSAGNGGGIHNGGTLVLSNSIISGNATGNGSYGTNGGDGGGIWNYRTLELSNCTVSGNSTGNGGSGEGGYPGGSGGAGGGIYNAGNVMVDNSTISGNSAGDGGNADYDGGKGGDGGGTFNAGTLTLNNSTVSGNTTGNGGNGFYNGGKGGDGGGIHNNYGRTAKLANSTVSGNTTGDGGSAGPGGTGGFGGDGGGIYNRDTLTLSNCTVVNNTTGNGGTGGSGGHGGGIFEQRENTTNSKSTIIADNTAAGRGPDFYGTLTSYGCNLIEDITDCIITDDEAGNIYGQDPLLGPLADNGGPTQTHALLFASPAIDAVIECDCSTVDGDPISQDQRGMRRPADGDMDRIAYCDIGAYEKQPISVGGIVEQVDLAQSGVVTDETTSGTTSNSWLPLWIGLASAFAAGVGILAIVRRRARAL